MKFESESELEESLMAHDYLLSEHFGLEGNISIRNQVVIPGYGVCDILCSSVRPLPNQEAIYEITVIELKNTPLCHAHFSQVARYKKGIEHAFASVGKTCSVKGILVGEETFPSRDDLCFLASQIDWLEVYEFSICPVNGVDFNLVPGWIRSEAGEDQQDEFCARIIRDCLKELKEAAPEPANLVAFK